MAEFDYPNADLLVSVAWLAQHLHDPQVKILDARSARDYSAGHIPRAVKLEWTELVDAATGLLKPADEMRRLLAAKGITPDKEIVSYCQGGGRAAHGVLTLQLLGYDRMRNFDGSYGAYAASTAPVER